VATFTFSSTIAETKTITATAGGVALNDRPTITVQKTSSTVEITDDDPDPSTVGAAITVEFSVRGSGGTPTGEVIVTLSGGDETCRATLVDGNGSCILTPTVAGPDANNNRRIVTATYGGDARFSGDTDTENHRVNPAPQPNQAPTAAFTPPSCTVGVPCPFNDGSTDSDGHISSRFWTFQDAVPSTSGEQNPTVIFSSAGSKTVTLEVTDNERATDTETQQVTVTLPTPQNQAPTAGDDAYATPGAGQGMTIPAPGVLSNDTDPDGPQPLVARTASDPALGSVLLNQDGSFTYTPDLGATGTDSFTYEAFDGALATTATVTITITP
jgi:VCBS repeat-containing protein